MPADPLSATFSALADPTRRAILARLASGETTVNELATPFRMTLPAVTKHLKVLERAGLISRSRKAQSRPCHIEPEPLRTATDWMVQYRHIWEARLDRLDDFLARLQAAQSGSTGKTPALQAPTVAAAPIPPGSAVPISSAVVPSPTKTPAQRRKK